MLYNNKITILLATFNGGKYLNEQLDSIIEQTYTNWELIIRDDNSSDNTLEIINYYVKKETRIKLIQTKSLKAGACGNFSALYDWAKSNRNSQYLMFSDQDDIWKPNKIEYTLFQVKETENRHPTKPVMAYGNLQLMSEQGEDTNDSIILLPILHLNKILAQNYCFGCTMMINVALIHEMSKISLNAENHDYWVALLAVSLGYTIFIDEKLIRYRQHSNNVTSQGNTFQKRFDRYFKNLEKEVARLGKRVLMIKTFYNEYHHKLTVNDVNMVDDYIQSFKKNRMITVYQIIKYNILRLTVFQNLALIFLIAIRYKKIAKIANN